MKAMILAAGRGERMMPLTADQPKPLLHVAGKSLIEHLLQKLAQAGFAEIVMNVSWCADQIVEKLGSGEQFNLNIAYSREPEALETGGAIRFAQTLLGADPFVLINADVFSDYPFEKLKKMSFGQGKLGHLVLVQNPLHHPGGDYRISDQGFLMAKNHPGVSSGNAPGPSYTFSGISVIHPDILVQFPQTTPKFPLRELFSWGIKEKVFTAENYAGKWVDVGTPARLHALDAELTKCSPDRA